jgi:glutaredoxin
MDTARVTHGGIERQRGDAVSEAADITLLTQPDCRYCEHAKQVLARLSADYDLRVTEIDLTGEPGRRMARAVGVMFAPGVLVDGRPFSFGRLSERKLRRTLDARARA